MMTAAVPVIAKLMASRPAVPTIGGADSAPSAIAIIASGPADTDKLREALVQRALYLGDPANHVAALPVG